MAAKAGVEPTTLRLRVIASTNAPPCPTMRHHVPQCAFMSHLLAPPPCRAGPSPWLAHWYGMVSHGFFGHFLGPRVFSQKLIQQLKTTLFGRAGVGSASEYSHFKRRYINCMH